MSTSTLPSMPRAIGTKSSDPSFSRSFNSMRDDLPSLRGRSVSTSPPNADLLTPSRRHHRLVTAGCDSEPEILDDDDSLHAPQRGRLGRLATRSMQSLKMSKEARTRSMTDSAPPQLVRPVPPSQPKPIASPLKSAKSGGFSSFLRKLTGRSKSKGSTSAHPSRPPPQPRRDTLPMVQTVNARPPVHRQESAPAPSHASRSATVVPTRQKSTAAQNYAQSQSLRGFHRPSVSLESIPHVRQAPPKEIQQSEQPRETDPCLIPLPPSPTLTPMIIQEEVPTQPLRSAISPQEPTRPSPYTVAGRARSSPMLSFEGFDFEDETDETDEEADVIRPLQPLRINTGRSHSPQPGGLKSGISETSTTLQTPSSATSGSAVGLFASPVDEEDKSVAKFAGSSPPRKAPVGTGANLDRRQSKWRKSVMNISDSINGNVARKSTIRQPPTSHDAYLAQQRRIENSRLSCQPTLHSTASIAAELREIRSKEEAEVAETFFLS